MLKADCQFPICALLLIILYLQISSRQCLHINQSIRLNTSQLAAATANRTEPLFVIKITEVRKHCVQMECKFVCFNGKSTEIADDINKSMDDTHINCDRIKQLSIYNYEFPNDRIEYNFLGEFSKRIERLYLASSNVSDYDDGAFGNAIFSELYFENLKLVTLRKEFFTNISNEFHALTVIQKNLPLMSIAQNFLEHVRYQIKHLSLQIGTKCVRNITASDNLLNNLIYVDFSYNDFGDTLMQNTFNRLSVPEHLDLSYSNISYLPEYIFADFISTLEYLDISHNQLVTITCTIFGWRDIPLDIKIYAQENPWHCDCELQIEMNKIFPLQTTLSFCATPLNYETWSVLDERICNDNSKENSFENNYTMDIFYTTDYPMTTTSTVNSTHIFTTHLPLPPTHPTNDNTVPSIVVPGYSTTSTTSTTPLPGTTTEDSDDDDDDDDEGDHFSEYVQLHCLTPPYFQLLKWPLMQFCIHVEQTFRVTVSIESTNLNSSYGLLWFSKVTTQFYKMETNYNEYGLGCYSTISHETHIENLLPNMAYTVCVVLKDQLTISPFNCKSIHIDGNVNLSYSTWLTRDMKATGISVTVLAIVMFIFLGVCIVFLIVKRKPILIKGSKRVAMTKGNKDAIVVFPKNATKNELKQREEMLAQRSFKRHTLQCKDLRRSDSNESIDSNQSYINANLYEVIPAYLKFDEVNASPTCLAPPTPTLSNYDVQPDSYLPPLTMNSSIANLVSYVEIPYRSKRTSNDPLPSIPHDQPPSNTNTLTEFSIDDSFEHSENADIDDSFYYSPTNKECSF